jgi:hypothetical protein
MTQQEQAVIDDQKVLDAMRDTSGLFLAAGFKKLKLPAEVVELAMGRIVSGKLCVAVVMEFRDVIQGTCTIYDPVDGKVAYSFSIAGGERVVFDNEKAN